ncbi:hypothetical protein [Cyclobacterium qasimii]|uniref:Transglutaminase n=1 Tax=Cyclobacterium qasimii M12-11B TaxID=641524 RepID=S7WX96_9BACT|nr:hypothetical protein [Cyclobacterium qasimii]EPR71409.1 Transglutaminase [Cyclobacterium qasimii M12-11B]
MKNLSSFVPLICLCFLCFAFVGCQSKEKDTKQSDNITKPTPKVDIADIEDGIKAFITNKAAENDGYFLVKDDNKLLRLHLVRVHTEYLSNLGPNSHFACVDLADTSGDVYDVDFFMEGKPGEMEVTETTVHKLNGKPFYSWKQKPDKTWYRLPVAEASNKLLGVIEGEDQFQFNYEVILPTIEGTAKMWIPVAVTDHFQEIELIKQEVPGKHEIIKDDVNKNDILFLDLSSEESGKPVTLVYNVKRKEKGPYEDSSEIAPRYLESSALMPVGRRFRELALEAIGEKRKTVILCKPGLYTTIS